MEKSPIDDFHWHQDEMYCNFLGERVAVLKGLPREGSLQEGADAGMEPAFIDCLNTERCSKAEVPCVRALIHYPENYIATEKEIEPSAFRDFLFEEKTEASEKAGEERAGELGDEIHPKFT